MAAISCDPLINYTKHTPDRLHTHTPLINYTKHTKHTSKLQQAQQANQALHAHGQGSVRRSSAACKLITQQNFMSFCLIQCTKHSITLGKSHCTERSTEQVA
eukprot:scaffold290040_cov33-Tisochrysis_lutea.AAC.1